MAVNKNKFVLITNGTRFSEVTEYAWKNSADLYKNEGYREASEKEIITFTGATLAPVKAVPKKAAPPEKTKD